MKVRTELQKAKKEVRGKKGFTLIELVIVIAVLAIIAFIAVPTVTNIIGNANTTADSSNAQQIELTIKTAQSEVAANDTTPSDRVATLKGDSGKLLTTLLKAYGVDLNLEKLKVSGNHYYYSKGSGKVVVANAAPTVSSGSTSDYIQLTNTTKYTMSGDKLTVGE
jgi:prepilin-type N-terminal cleavage/methylation domain-containing protein